MSRNSGDESGATNGEGASAQEGQSDGQFGGLTPERRLQELQAEMERLSQMISGSSQRSMPEFGRRDPCSELRRYSKVLSGVLPKFPTEAEAPVWFESVESALEAYGVPREFWGLLVFPLVAARVPYLSARLSPAQHRDYSVIKETVLDELKLSAGEYLKRFLWSEKHANEGWRPFATRLQSYLHFYLGAREVSTFEALVELLVADQLKRNLSEEARRYVTLQEGRKWMNAPEITAFLRTFEEAQGANSAAKQVRQRAAESPVTSGLKRGSQTGTRGDAKGQGAKVNTKPKGCYACGASGHKRWNCPAPGKSQASKDPGVNSGSLTARVSVEEPAAARSDHIPVSLDCNDMNIRAVLDTGAEITVLRESAIPPETVQPRGTVNLTSAFGERLEVKLAVIPLAMSREGAVGTDVQDAVPALCALTDRLTEKTDCLLSERAWNLLNEQRAFHGVVKDAAGVGNPQLSREGGSSNPGTVQQHHGEVSTCAHSLKEHAAEEEAPAECSAVGPEATQSVVQECCGTDIVGQHRCSESLHENLELRGKIKSEDASLVEMLAKDRRCADNRCTGGAGVEVSGKYWELLGSTPAVTSVGQHEIGPQKGFSPGKALESAQVVVEREGTSKSEKDHVVPSARYCFRNSAGVGCPADDPGKLADSGEREAPTAEAQCRGMPGCGYEQSVLPRHAAVRGHLAELAGVRVPNGIPGYAVADRVSPRFRAALRETAASAMIDIEKPSWLCTLASAVSAGTCLPQRAEHVTDAPGMFSRQGFSPTQVSCPAVGAGIWVI
ncbi:hypothetical protein HPB50_019301 [Hyalomma asiaticum]|uniref:Uncharacterized protein n=1 Tax=Hyalomma asiaticum TaxID=266040 RepID=A0ACB7RQP9_HYAAI|nr:hypothetical protein HPB50_019301 [Hyalomma asiaticum]